MADVPAGKPSNAKRIRDAIAEHGAMTLAQLTAQVQAHMTAAQCRNAVSAMLNQKLLVAERDPWPPRYALGREAKQEQTQVPPEFRVQRRRQRDNGYHRKQQVAAQTKRQAEEAAFFRRQAARAKNPGRPTTTITPSVIPMNAPIETPAPAMSVEEWLANPANKIEVLPSPGYREYASRPCGFLK